MQSKHKKSSTVKIIMQMWNLEDENWDNYLGIPDCGFSTRKEWILNSKNWGLALCITKGYRESYFAMEFPNANKLPETDNRICLLWQKFKIDNVKPYYIDGLTFYAVSGQKRAATFVDPIVLDYIPNFENFERSYMRTGMTNIADDQTGVTRKLLELSGELPFYPGF